MNKNSTIMIVLLFFSNYISSMEENICKPCTDQEERKFFYQFREKNCDAACRARQLEKLAEKYDEKDAKYLRALLCADRGSNDNTYISSNNKIESHIPFIDIAIAKRNVPFLKVFFAMFSKNSSTRIRYYDSDGLESRSIYELKFNQHEAVKSKEVSEIVFKSVARPINPSVCPRETLWKLFSGGPGCGIAQEIKKKQEEFKNSLREVANK